MSPGLHGYIAVTEQYPFVSVPGDEDVETAETSFMAGKAELTCTPTATTEHDLATGPWPREIKHYGELPHSWF